jgi:hypothetical protein
MINPVDILHKAKALKPDDDIVTSLTRKVTSISKKDTDEFSESPFMQYFHASRMQALDVSLATALNIDLYPLLVPEIMYALKSNSNVNLSIFGRPGSGKSTYGLSVYEHFARITGVPVKVRNMFSNGALLWNRLLDLFPHEGKTDSLQKNDVLFVDENPNDTTGLGAVHNMTQTKEMEVRIRKKQIHFIWVSTVLYTHQSQVILETWDSLRGKGVDFWKLQKIRCLVYSHDQILRGSMTLPAPDQSILLAYNKHIKDEGLKQFFSGEMDPRAAMMRQVADSCSKNPKFQNCINKEQRMQFLDETFGYMKLSMGMQARILGLCKPMRDNTISTKSEPINKPKPIPQVPILPKEEMTDDEREQEE